MNIKRELANHPCFNEKAKHQYARIHLPVARLCNIQCKFCNRKYDCINESRPGVTSAVLSPGQALSYLKEMKTKLTNLAVVGIAGPGDPFAEPDITMETLKLVSEAYPDILLCVATNAGPTQPTATQPSTQRTPSSYSPPLINHLGVSGGGLCSGPYRPPLAGPTTPGRLVLAWRPCPDCSSVCHPHRSPLARGRQTPAAHAGRAGSLSTLYGADTKPPKCCSRFRGTGTRRRPVRY